MLSNARVPRIVEGRGGAWGGRSILRIGLKEVGSDRVGLTGWTLWVVLLLSFAGPAWGSNLVEVRAGVHPAHTRVVLELDEAAPYALNRLATKANGTEVLHLTVEAGGAVVHRVAPAGSPHLKMVVVDASENGRTALKIRLARDTELKEMVLRGPDRIVLDFYAVGSGKGTLLSTLVAPAPPGTARAPDATRMPTPVAELPDPPAERPSLDDSHDAEFNQALAEVERAQAQTAPEAVAVVESVAEANETTEEALEVAPDLVDYADPEDSALDEAAEAEGLDEADAFDGVEMAEVVPESKAMPTAEPADDGASSGGSLLGSPLALAAIAGVALLGLWFVLGRRRASEPDDGESLSPLDAPSTPEETDEALGSLFDGNDVNEAEGGEAEVVDADAPAPFVAQSEDSEPQTIVVPGGNETSFENDSASEESTVDESFDYPAISPGTSDAGSAPPLSAPSDLGNSEVSKVVEEFERRIAHLESRLEEMFDAKDRLERQVAAQTEELRVQRAAIARTQRVLRTIARPEDDEPSEPAPKL